MAPLLFQKFWSIIHKDVVGAKKGPTSSKIGIGIRSSNWKDQVSIKHGHCQEDCGASPEELANGIRLALVKSTRARLH